MTRIVLDVGAKARALAKKLRKTYANEFRKSMGSSLSAAGRNTVGALKRSSPRGATGKLAQAHDSALSDDKLSVTIFNRLQRSLFLAGGTGPAATPPRPGKFPWDATRQANPLRDWVLKKGIAADIRANVNSKRKKKRITLSQAQDIGAFLVGRAIKRKGVQPNKWFEDTIEQELPRIRLFVRNSLAAFLRESRNKIDGPG